MTRFKLDRILIAQDLFQNSASDGGDSKMSSMLPMMMMMSPQGSGSNPMLPMILGMMGKLLSITKKEN